MKKQKYNIRSMMNPDILSTRVREEGKSAKYGRNNFGVGTITGGLLHTTNVPCPLVFLAAGIFTATCSD